MIAHCELMGDRIAILDTPPDLNAAAGPGVADERGRLRLQVRRPVLAVGQGLRPGVRAPTGSCRRAGTWPASGRATTTPAACTRRRPTRWSAARSTWRPRSPRPSTTCSTRSASTASAFPGRGIRVWGARTLSSDPEWRYLNVRRLFNYLEESILARHPVGRLRAQRPALWARINRTISAFLDQRVAQGRAVRHHAGRGVLRQVRRRDQPGRGHRRRPGRLPDRRRAGEAGRVRHLPAVAVLRRHQPRHRE